MSNTAVVICHGSYHTPSPYEPLLEALRLEDIAAFCPQLATADLSKLNVGNVENPDFDREPPAEGYPQGDHDVAIVARVLDGLVNDGKRVLIVGHSAGGWVATQAARPDYHIHNRQQKGLPGGIVGILYMGAFVIPVGESINSFFQPKDTTPVVPPFMRFHKHGFKGLGTLVQPEKFIFNGVEPAISRKYAQTLTASPILTTKLTNDAYSTLKCAYLVLDEDLTLPKEYQEGMIALQESKQDSPFIVYHCPAGHSPHLSWTAGVVDTIKDFLIKLRIE